MARPTTRILALLELLQARGSLSGPELAQRLEVDERTLRRYIRALEDLGVPVTAERGRHGGYSLVSGFKLPPMMFNNDEALALSLGLVAARGLGLAEAAPAVEGLQAKLERVMPQGLQRQLQALAGTVTLDLPDVQARADHAALLRLAAAAQARQRVWLRYRSEPGQVSEREFDAYGLVYRSGRWYVSGWCHLRAGLRSFRLDRIEALEAREAHFIRPADFDVTAHLRQSIVALPRALDVDVLLHAPLDKVAAELGGALGMLVPEGGHTRLHTQTDAPAWFARQLLRLPFDVEVRKPAALRKALASRARKLLALNS
jgi:predicted DNA-binding transcriptional regulator YafY